MKIKLRMEVVSLMFSTACNALGRHENLVLHCLSPFFMGFHRFSLFSPFPPFFKAQVVMW